MGSGLMIRWRQSVSTWGRAALPVIALVGAAVTASLAGCVAAGAGRMPMDQTPFPKPDLSFTLRDGFVLPARHWLPPAGTHWRGVILALHGFADSRDAWEYPAPGFAAVGYAVIAPDQRGFGATADRGIWAGTTTMVDDAQDLASQLRRRYPAQRLIVMGESMGGAVALCLAARPANTVDATVLLAPAVWGRAQMGPAMVGLLSVANGVAPGWVLSGSDVPKDIAASDNREALIRLFEDPLTERASRVLALQQALDALVDEVLLPVPNRRLTHTSRAHDRSRAQPIGRLASTIRAHQTCFCGQYGHRLSHADAYDRLRPGRG